MNGQSQRGAPQFAGDQRAEILRLLREAGPAGVSKETLIFEKHFTQAAARMWELGQQGYAIKHESRSGERYIRFVLVGEPAEPKPLPTYRPADGRDWFTESTGKPRAAAASKPDFGPLFSSTDGNP